MHNYSVLSKVNSPDDLKKLDIKELPVLCDEIRNFLVEKVSKTGGHLASNLGAVELSVGMHYVFSSPNDHLMFDVGHQCYVHKILTGRRDRFDNLRKLDGISGFLKPDESEHDCFVSGHASNSISAVLGMARADKLLDRHGRSVCLIGDGALTGGMAYEALNDAGSSGLPIIIIINDNDMSISKSVGGMAQWLSQIRLKKKYFSLKNSTQDFLRHFGKTGRKTIEIISVIKESFRRKVLPANIFSVLGYNYLGPADGNDIEKVITLLSEAKKYNKPVVVHFKTVKGKGYEYSEKHPDCYHGVPAFNTEVGHNGSSSYSFADTFGKTMCELAGENERVCAVTAAMDMGTGLSEFKTKYPDRFFDVGIAEAHAVGMCAGMAKEGMIPVFAVYSTFLQRAYDQLLHDVSLNSAKVIFAVDHSGSVGNDGPTHHGFFDTSFLRSVPNMKIYAPSSHAELTSAVRKSVALGEEPVAIKYPKGKEGAFKDDTFESDALVLKEGKDVTFVTYGIVLNGVIAAACLLEEKGINPEIVKLNRIDKLDNDLILRSASKTRNICIVEDCIESGSVGEKIATLLSTSDVSIGVKLINFKDSFGEVGAVSENYKRHGLSESSIAEEVIEMLGARKG